MVKIIDSSGNIKRIYNNDDWKAIIGEEYDIEWSYYDASEDDYFTVNYYDLIITESSDTIINIKLTSSTLVY